MDELPLLVYRELFGRHFSFKEKQKLRLVCKKWNFLIRIIIEESQEQLVVYKHISPWGVKWPDSKQRIDFDRDAAETSLLIECHEHRMNKRPFERIGFPKNLRKLCLFRLKFTAEPFLEAINQLEKLNCLCLERCFAPLDPPKGYNNELTLELPNLKTLSLKFCLIAVLNLKKAKLTRLVQWTNYSEKPVKINFEHPETIRQVECDRFSFSKHKFKFQNLTNLEKLVCLTVGDQFDLKEFPRLKKVASFPWQFGQREDIEKLKRQKVLLKRSDLVISVFGFQNGFNVFLSGASSNHPINERYEFWKMGKETCKKFARLYPDLSYPIPWLFEANYGELVESFGSIPSDFLSKVTSVYKVTLSQEVQCEQTFLRFLRESGVRHLELNVALSQNFYDLLPTVKSIDSFVFSYFGDISLEFLFGMLPNITFLRFDFHKLSMHFLERLLQKSKNPFEFVFRALVPRSLIEFCIRRYSVNRLDFSINGTHMSKAFEVENLAVILSDCSRVKPLIDFDNRPPDRRRPNLSLNFGL